MFRCRSLFSHRDVVDNRCLLDDVVAEAKNNHAEPAGRPSLLLGLHRRDRVVG
jgi:hypothetical protein